MTALFYPPRKRRAIAEQAARESVARDLLLPLVDDVQARARLRWRTTSGPGDRSGEFRASSGDFAATGSLRSLRGPRSPGGHGGRSGGHPFSAGTEAARDGVAPLPRLHPRVDGLRRQAKL